MNIAIILAAGSSTRFAFHQEKLLAPVLGKPLIYYTIMAFHDHPAIHEVYLVVSKKNERSLKELVKQYQFPRVKKIIRGGKTRQESFQKGLESLRNVDNDDIILVHNAANPLVTEEEINQTIKTTQKYNATIVGKKIVDTIKEIKKEQVVKTHDREYLIAAQTPQASLYKLFKKALQKAKKQKKNFTDESSLLENIGQKIKFIPASEHNFKITTLEDYERLKIIMGDKPENFLVGLGQDSHHFSPTQKGLMLGGFLLKSEMKLQADSDGDVILHALYNAISQALGEGSLGRFATPLLKEKGISDSKKYLQSLLIKVQKQGYKLNNIGLMIEGQKPKIDPIASKIKTSLSALTKLPIHKIGITATTGEKLTSFGEGKGLQCFAIVSLKHEN